MAVDAASAHVGSGAILAVVLLRVAVFAESARGVVSGLALGALTGSFALNSD